MSSKRESTQVTQAKEILRGRDATLDELKQLADDLKNEKAFEYARKILQQACSRPELAQHPKRPRFIQQYALCTYKDPDLPPESKFDDALKILQQLGSLKTLEDRHDLSVQDQQETLGLAGAIHKYKWEVYGQKQYLEQSLAFYRRGYRLGILSDDGYTAINTAFVLDEINNLDRETEDWENPVAQQGESRGQEAVRIRQEIVNALDPEPNQPVKGPTDEEQKTPSKDDWWRYVTIAEAYFGLGHKVRKNYDKAREWLKKAVNLPDVPEWEYASTARQLATLARLHTTATGDTTPLEKTPAWKALEDFLGAKYASGIQGIFLGKVGLALSGGGFRASLFHIGVLARLAELDMLRHIEVLSCVSGGSILGAHYYLELRRLMQRSDKEDARITREDYIEIVKNIERDFLAGV